MIWEEKFIKGSRNYFINFDIPNDKDIMKY